MKKLPAFVLLWLAVGVTGFGASMVSDRVDAVSSAAGGKAATKAAASATSERPTANEASTISFVPNGSDTRTRSVNERLRDTIHVTDFATGGTGTAQNPWTGWESAVNRVAAGNNIYFPCGYYAHAATIVYKAGWSLEGGGYKCAQVRYTGTGTAHSVGGAAAGVNDTSISKLVIHTTSGATGVLYRDLVKFTLRDTTITGFRSYGVRMHADALYVISGTIDNVDIYRNATGVSSVGLNNASNGHNIVNSRIRNNIGDNIRIENLVFAWRIQGNVLEAPGAGFHAIRILGGGDFTLDTNYYETGSTGPQIFVERDAAGIQISNSTFVAPNNATLIRLGKPGFTAVQNVSVFGNSFGQVGGTFIDPVNVIGLKAGPNNITSVAVSHVGAPATNGYGFHETVTGLHGMVAATRFVSLSNPTATPSARISNHLRLTSPAGALAITNFANGLDGQLLVLLFSDSNISIADDGNFRLNGHFTSSADDVLVLVCYGSRWYEVMRSAN